MDFHSIGNAFQKAIRLLTKEVRCHACSCPFVPPEGSSHHSSSGLFCPECKEFLTIREKGFCPLCGDFSGWEKLEPSLCGTCLQSPPPWQSLVFYNKYEHVLQDLILRLKFHSTITNAYSLGVLLSEHPKLLEKMREVDCVVPIPLHSKRLEERGYNQTLEIAKQLLICTGKPLPLYAKGLVRTRETIPQLLLTRAERKKNQVGTFAACASLAGSRVAILDDVITTGATLEAATLALQKVGVASVHIFAIARTDSHDHH